MRRNPVQDGGYPGIVEPNLHFDHAGRPRTSSYIRSKFPLSAAKKNIGTPAKSRMFWDVTTHIGLQRGALLIISDEDNVAFGACSYPSMIARGWRI